MVKIGDMVEYVTHFGAHKPALVLMTPDTKDPRFDEAPPEVKLQEGELNLHVFGLTEDVIRLKVPSAALIELDPEHEPHDGEHAGVWSEIV